jgi:hypothetical protein
MIRIPSCFSGFLFFSPVDPFRASASGGSSSALSLTLSVGTFGKHDEGEVEKRNTQ